MSKIVIIGAGAMGSAFAVPCADNSNEVFLVGSFLEDKVIEEINSNKNFHPTLKCQLPSSIKVLKFSEFNEEIKVAKCKQKGGCNELCIVHAFSSIGESIPCI